jgi:hypothetical protein
MIACSRTFCWYFCWYRIFSALADTNSWRKRTHAAHRHRHSQRQAGRKAAKLSDGGGLFLLIQPGGTKLWRLAYRFAGKQKLLAFGVYPTISLSDARAQRDAARKHLADGVDPAVQRKLEKQAKVVTFRLVADELVSKMRREERAEATLTKTSWLLEFAFSDIGDRPISKITAQELLTVLRKIEARGNYETARRLRSTAWCFALR